MDLNQCLLGGTVESTISDFVSNVGSYKFKVDSIYFTGADASAFQLVSNSGTFGVEPNKSQNVEMRFIPNRIGKHTADVVIVTQAETITKSITGMGVAPQLKVVNNILNFGTIDLGDTKNLSNIATLTNVGSAPITFSKVDVQCVNDNDFKNLDVISNKVLKPGDTLKMNLNFTPNEDGRTSGRLIFHHNAAGSQEIVQLFGTALLPKVQKYDIDLGSIDVNTTKDVWAFALKNEGKVNVTIRGGEITGGNSTEFELFNNTFPIEIKPNETAKLNVRFKPTTIGNVSSTLKLRHNAVDGFSNINLTGFGIETIAPPTDRAIIIVKNIQPNPVVDYIEIYYGFNTLEKGDIKITNVLGEVVYTGNLEKTDNGYLKIDSHKFGVGQYFVTLKSENVVKTFTIKILR